VSKNFGRDSKTTDAAQQSTMPSSQGWAFSMETLFSNRASMLAATEVGFFLLMVLPDKESEEIMATWSSDDAPITNAVISYNEFIDKVARRITLASIIAIQQSWKLYKKGFLMLD
jgi:hypothetical protein